MSASVKVNGTIVEAPEGAVAYVYASPVNGAEWIYDEGQALSISVEDPSLVEWVDDSDALVRSELAKWAEIAPR